MSLPCSLFRVILTYCSQKEQAIEMVRGADGNIDSFVPHLNDIGLRSLYDRMDNGYLLSLHSKLNGVQTEQ